jgi:hypothetical protein
MKLTKRSQLSRPSDRGSLDGYDDMALDGAGTSVFHRYPTEGPRAGMVDREGQRASIIRVAGEARR